MEKCFPEELATPDLPGHMDLLSTNALSLAKLEKRIVKLTALAKDALTLLLQAKKHAKDAHNYHRHEREEDALESISSANRTLDELECVFRSFERD